MPDNHALRRHDGREPLQRQGNGEQRNRKNAANLWHRFQFYVSTFERQGHAQFPRPCAPVDRRPVRNNTFWSPANACPLSRKCDTAPQFERSDFAEQLRGDDHNGTHETKKTDLHQRMRHQKQ